MIKRDLGELLLKLEELLEERQKEAMRRSRAARADGRARSGGARAPARSAICSIASSKTSSARGVVGEETNKLVGYLAATSSKLEQPLAVVIQSSSAAGKSSLMDAVLALMPEEERVQYSAMTGQSLFYMGETNLTAQDPGDRRRGRARSARATR